MQAFLAILRYDLSQLTQSWVSRIWVPMLLVPAFFLLVVASTDYLKALPDSIAKWVNARVISLGTDGFGRSDTREVLRDFF